MRKYQRYIIGSTVAVLLAVILFTVLSRRPAAITYPITRKPRVGDQAVVTIHVPLNPIKGPHDFYDRLHSGGVKVIDKSVIVRCTGVDGRKRILSVYYLDKRGKQSLAYTVSIDYSAKSVRNRSVVRDAQGRVVPVGAKVGGWPVPFHYWLTFDDMRSVGYSANGIYFQYESFADGQTDMVKWVGLRARIVVHSDRTVQQRQCWRRGDWLWYVTGFWSKENGDEYTATVAADPRPQQ